MQAIDPNKLQAPLKMIGLNKKETADPGPEPADAQSPQPSTENLREGMQNVLETSGEKPFLQSDHQPNESAAKVVAQDH